MKYQANILCRRHFLGCVGGSLLTMGLCGGQTNGMASQVPSEGMFESISCTDNTIRIYSRRVERKSTLFLLADTHLFRDDTRGEPFRQYSKRMAGAYNKTNHYKTGKATNPEEAFEMTLAMAQKEKGDAIALLGDIVSFPSEAAVDWVYDRLEKSGLNWMYTSGNHDWHYEGIPGHANEQRNEWTQKRLIRLYRDHTPLAYAVGINGIRILMFDNSTNEIEPEQLAFFRKEASTGKPLLLMMHIPLYVPGRNLNFGCGHPHWNEKHDRGWKIERREPWPVTGHTQTTFDFHREVFTTPNLLGIFAGHVHRQLCDIVQGKPQFTTEANATAGFLRVELLPLDSVSGT